MNCVGCKYFLDKQQISLLSQMMGYICECGKIGTMYKEIPARCMCKDVIHK
jgi:hypothetical protein